MKKTLLAAALMAGFAGVAQAETSVTLYGILDGGIGYEQLKGKASYLENRTGVQDFKSTRTGLIQGVQFGNRWGLKGSEDLGNGLRAVFVLESGFNLDTGTHAQGDRLFGRQATMGLASDSWGQIDLGRQTNIASKYLPGVVSPFGASFGQANAGAVFSQANTARYDNMIMYQTPNFSGFQFGVGYSFNINGSQSSKWDETGTLVDGLERNTRAFTTGVRYSSGPIAAALTYDTYTSPETRAVVGGPVSGDVNVHAWALGASYDFEVVKVYLGGGQTRNGMFANQGYLGDSAFNNNSVAGSFRAADGLKVNSYSVGLSAPLAGGTIMASWMMADPTDGPDAWNAVGQPARTMEKQNTYSLGYTYNLSKRTSMYAFGSYADNVYFLPEAKSTIVGLGLVHKF